MTVLLLFMFLIASPQDDAVQLRELFPDNGVTFHGLAVSEERGLHFSVCDSRLDGEPGWSNPDAVLPPLTITAAIRKSQAALVAYVDDTTAWTLTRVTVRHLRDQRWAYIVRFFSRGETLEIPVLFSGYVVPGESFDALSKRDCTLKLPPPS